MHDYTVCLVYSCVLPQSLLARLPLFFTYFPAIKHVENNLGKYYVSKNCKCLTAKYQDRSSSTGLTHSPPQHDLCVTDGVGRRDVRSDHRAVRDPRARLWHLVNLRGNAVGTLAVHVHGYDTKLVGGAWNEKSCFSLAELTKCCHVASVSRLNISLGCFK